MTLYDIEKLTRDVNQDNLYNFFEPTFRYFENVPLNYHFVQVEEEMRFDLVSNAIYTSTDEVDFLCNMNNIDNPLNVMKDDIIVFVAKTLIPDFRPQIVDNTNAVSSLLNKNKVAKKDPARKDFVANNFALPPTVKQTPIAPVRIEENQIVIGG